MHAEVPEQRLQLLEQPVARGVVARLVAERELAVASRRVTRFSACGRSSVESQKSTAWLGDLARARTSGASLVISGFSPRYIVGYGLADHLDVAHRELPGVAREVVVVDAERLLEDGRVGLLGDREHRLAVVEHVVAPDLVGAVGEPVRMLVVGRGEQQLGGVGGAAGDDDDVGRVGLASRRRARRRPR